MKILIAGLGSIGRRHFRNLLAMGENDLVLLRSHLSTLPDDELVGYPIETDLEAALNHGPSAAIISNPTALHLDVAIPCAKAGCHMLIEKPVSNSMDCMEDLKSAVVENGGKTLIGFHLRYHPNMQRLRELLYSGEIGAPISFRAHWGEYLPDWHPWENFQKSYSARKDLGGGVILTLSHPIDYLRWIFGEVDSLWAFHSRTGSLEIDVEDIAEIGLRFKSGVLGTVHLDYIQRPPTHNLEVIGTEGTISWEASSGTLHVFNSKKNEWREYLLPDGFTRNDLFLAEMHHFLQVCLGTVQPVCSLEDGISALQIALAAIASQENGALIYL